MGQLTSQCPVLPRYGRSSPLGHRGRICHLHRRVERYTGHPDHRKMPSGCRFLAAVSGGTLTTPAGLLTMVGVPGEVSPNNHPEYDIIHTSQES